MDVLKKPVIACLISILIVVASTGYLFVFGEGEPSTERGEMLETVPSPTGEEAIEITEGASETSSTEPEMALEVDEAALIGTWRGRENGTILAIFEDGTFYLTNDNGVTESTWEIRAGIFYVGEESIGSVRVEGVSLIFLMASGNEAVYLRDSYEAIAPERQTNMIADGEYLTNLLYLTLSLDFDSLLAMVDEYLENPDVSENDVAYEIRELALRGAELAEIVDVVVDDFDGQITVYYPGIREISSTVRMVPYIRPEPSRVHGRAAPRVRANFRITKGFVRQDWLHFDRTELRMSNDQIVWRNYESGYKTEDVVQGGVREEARRWSHGLFHVVNNDGEVRNSGYIYRFATQMDVNYDHVLRFVNRGRDENYDVVLSDAEISALATLAELFIIMGRLTEGIPTEYGS